MDNDQELLKEAEAAIFEALKVVAPVGMFLAKTFNPLVDEMTTGLQPLVKVYNKLQERNGTMDEELGPLLTFEEHKRQEGNSNV